jgi:thiol-disulfide isomerase/thioredoxin
MMSLSIGPLALPVAPIQLLLAYFLAAWMVRWVFARADQGDAAASRHGLAKQAGDALLNALLLGLLAGRMVFVAQNAQAYASEPWAALDVRDGGWNPWAVAMFGLAWVAWRQHGAPVLRQALWAGAVLGLGVWLGVTVLLSHYQPTALPEVTVVELESGRSALLPQVSLGKPRVINLWASWCGPCRQEMPMLAAAQQREKSVDILFINEGESADAVRAYLHANQPTLGHVWLDPQSALGPALGSRGLPTTLFVDAQGRLVDTHMGVLNGPALASKLKQLQF